MANNLKLNGDEVITILKALKNHEINIQEALDKNPGPSLDYVERLTSAARLARSAYDKIASLLSVDLTRED